MVLVAPRADHPLDWKAGVGQVPVAGDVDLLKMVEERGAVVPGHVRRPLHDVVAVKSRNGNKCQIGDVESHGELPELIPDLDEDVPIEVH